MGGVVYSEALASPNQYMQVGRQEVRLSEQQMEPVTEGDEVRLLMFEMVTGKCKHIKEVQEGMDPTPGYRSHASSTYCEWFLFDHAMCVPTHVLTVKAIPNMRVQEDDGAQHASASLPTDPRRPSTPPTRATAKSVFV